MALGRRRVVFGVEDLSGGELEEEGDMSAITRHGLSMSSSSWLCRVGLYVGPIHRCIILGPIH